MMIRQLEKCKCRLVVTYLSEGSHWQRRSEISRWTNKTKGAITRSAEQGMWSTVRENEKHTGKYIIEAQKGKAVSG